MAKKTEVECTTCGKKFKIKDDEVKRCPGCGKIHRGPNAPKE
jgi:DNA-directed RNA polymerase subunit RPC12/RpoP